MAARRAHGNKRHSGIFEQPVSGIQRRTSKRASSQDRQGHVYPDNFPATADADSHGEGSTPLASPTSSSAYASSPPTSRSPWPGGPERAGSSSSFRDGNYTNNDTADHTARRRTRTLEERFRERSPTAVTARTRNHHGSVHALPAISPQDSTDPSSSIGFPSIEPSNRSLSSRQRLVKAPPPRPLSPSPVEPPPTTHIPALPSPLPETAKVLQLMKLTCGRMQGILFFRTAAPAGPWSSGYCAINVATGSIIYQMKGDVSHAKTLVPDLRGCTVRTQNDADARASFLEIETRAAGAGVHLRPHVPETFDSWLAALLCWQPLRPKSARNSRATRSTLPGPAERRAGDRRRSSVMTQVKDAAIIKVGKMLYWDHEARAPAAPTDRRISTYRQQRLAAGAPWRKVSATLQENGLLKLYADASPSLLQVVPLSRLARCAVQRLHPTVLDDEFGLAVYPAYPAQSNHPVDLARPIFLSFDSRVAFEVWFVLLRAFAIPELYGPEASPPRALRASVDLSAVDIPPYLPTDGMFRVERVLTMRIVEAKVHAPQPPPDGAAENGYTPPRNKRAPSAHGRELLAGDYHAEVVLDGEVRGRTAVKPDTGNPFWREDYEFGDLPPVLAQAAVRLKARSQGRKDWTLISDAGCDYEGGDVGSLGLAGDVHVSPLDTIVGTVDLRLDDAERGKDREQWWPALNDKGQLVGEMLMKLRLDETIILMSHDYRSLSDLIHTFANGLTQEIALASSSETRKLHETFLNIFQVSGQAGQWIMALVEDEVDGIHRAPLTTKYRYSRRIASNDSYDSGVEREVFLRDMGRTATAEAHLLFRGNSLLTKALDLHMRRLGREYLEETLGESIRDIDESNPDCEVDPNRARDPADVQRNWRNLVALTENLWRSIAASAERCPTELRVIFRHIWSCADDRFGKFLRTVTYSSVSGFLFLRFFCPAVLNPKLFGLLKGQFSPLV